MKLLLTILIFIGLKIYELFLFLFKVIKVISVIVLFFSIVGVSLLIVTIPLGMLEVHVFQLLGVNKIYGLAYQLHTFSDFLANLGHYIDFGFFWYVVLFFSGFLFFMLLSILVDSIDNWWKINEFFKDNWKKAQSIVDRRK